MSHDARHMTRTAGRELVGGTVDRVVLTADRGEERFALVLAFPDGTEKISDVLSDAEGNDSGWLRISEPLAPGSLPRGAVTRTAKFEIDLPRPTRRPGDASIVRLSDLLKLRLSPNDVGALQLRARQIGVDAACAEWFRGC